METIVVTQSPPKTFQSGANNPAENNGDDTSFAPALAEAISKKNESEPSKSDPSKKEVTNTATPSPSKKKATPDESEENSAQALLLSQETDTVSSANKMLHLNISLTNSQSELVSKVSLMKGEINSQTTIDSNTNNIELSLLKQGSKTQLSSLDIELLSKSTVSQKSISITSQNQESFSVNHSLFQKNNNATPSSTDISGLKIQSEATDNITHLYSPNSKDSIKWTTSNNNSSQIIPRNGLTFVSMANETTSENPKLTVSTNNIIANLTDLPIEAEVPKGKTKNTTSLRHDIHGQYLDAKMQKSGINLEQQSGQQQLGTKDDPAQQSQLLSQSAKTQDTSTESTFVNTASNVIADKSNQQIAAASKPITTPLTTPVYEDDIILQVIQKFRSTSQLQDNKLVMKLHPAELGELKINIQLKSGSINANIVAQSQHVQEILEKNMPKLRNLMEQQGINIGDISVKLDSDVIADYNLFHQQFSRDDKSASFRKTAKSPDSFDLSLEDAENEQLTPQSGVNVKA